MDSVTDPAAVFERARPRLFGMAYRMLGSVADAEDLVQEAYLRWHQADRGAVRSPEGWLMAVIGRLSIDRLRRAAAERTTYVGKWLPEPVATGAWAAPGRATDLSSDLSMAFLVLLERLTPEERVAFLMREVFACDYAEIAQVAQKSEAACRQLVHRAREHVHAGRPRFAAPPESKERLLDGFLAALEADDKDALVSLFAQDATWTSDGGGKVTASRHVLVGADRIARFLLAIERKIRGLVLTHRTVRLNGEPTLVTSRSGQVVWTTSIATDGDRIVSAYRVLNPDKLRHVEGHG
ncbi:MAG TPA: RNA polymerase sigma factor SigJ [Candidatus Polarisedimenticolia bacterium]|jgi:RNA polymerase sigma-70 factor (ECF subfamily)|nr:RNA polymerase sigma factor SigJ [Candidatus Polarisedimenticolia bacterium]